MQVLLTFAFVLLGCTSEPEQVSGRVDLLDVSHAALATGTLRFVNGTYGPTCRGRSGGFSVALGTTATSMDYPELSVLRGDAACTLTLTSVVGTEAFTAQPPMVLTSAFAPAGTTFVGSTGGSSVAFFANSRITPSTFTSDFVIDLLVSDDPKATSAGNAAGSYTGPSSSKSSVSLSRASEVADGFSPILATVTIKNYSGKALPGLSVNLVYSGLASVSPANVTTDTNGVATFQLTSNVITQGELTAKVTGVLVSARPTVVFTRLPMVGGTVAGLSGTGLTLTLTSSSGVATLTPGNGAFAFPPVLKGAWSMAITAQPTLPKQICSLANGAGVVDYADVSNVAVTCLSAVPATVEYLVVGGGGSAGVGAYNGGGGGGAGGYRAGTGFIVTAQSYPITVGAGGSSSNGGSSTFATVTSAGGGKGGNWYGAGSDGASGGGDGGQGSVVPGLGNTPATNPPQGNRGGGGRISAINDPGGGGGGSGGVGGNASGETGGAGGAGTVNSISGVATNYGSGGGGISGANDGAPANSGNGGTFGGAGPASGIVIIRYKTDGSDGVSSSSTGGTKTTSGVYTIHTFTSDGTFVCVLP